MQFIKNGPDVPERLLHAHEEGRVVFFCGAGISYPAGLPGFKDLAEQLFNELDPHRSLAPPEGIDENRIDAAVDRLEARIVGGRSRVRKALADILLNPDPGAKNATTTHQALLALGRYRRGSESGTRLITTNFDRLFEKAINDKGLSVERFQAPSLPIPKSHWNGLVYLHGLLSVTPEPWQLDRLVLSSGDLGLAYLYERWAARFVGHLLQNHTVCFVGYSINDVVLRYMLDALATDRLKDESLPEMFAFGGYSAGDKDESINEWQDRKVTPILYHDFNNHDYLHKTLRLWAAMYRHGVRGKERIVARYYRKNPSASTSKNDFVGRMLWALSDPSGLPAKRFADMNPVPSLNWLKPLSELRYNQADLKQFNVAPREIWDDKLLFSVVSRPPPYHLVSHMSLASVDVGGTRFDFVMWHLARWLIRHLSNPFLLLWIMEQGGHLDRNLALSIDARLQELTELESEGKTDELSRIRANSPNAIPSRQMHSFWRLLLTGHVQLRSHFFDFQRWLHRFHREGLTPALRLELREQLMPRILLLGPKLDHQVSWDISEQNQSHGFVSGEVKLSVDNAHFHMPNLFEDRRWKSASSNMVVDFVALLRDALDLMCELGNAGERVDPSCLAWPSISDHPQNEHFKDWTALIVLTRDAWLSAAEKSSEWAYRIAEDWWRIPYPLFRRLIFFAATHDQIIPPRRALEWLLAEDQWWLWSIETQREAIRLLVTLASKWNANELAELERAIVAGPPSSLLGSDLEPDKKIEIVDRKIWIRLAKLDRAGAKLGATGQKRLGELSAKYPYWELTASDRDEFSVWIDEVGDDAEHEGVLLQRTAVTPRHRRELVDWIRHRSTTHSSQEDDWRQRCQENFATTACSLIALARDGVWPVDRWQEALEAWSTRKDGRRLWRYMGPVLANAADDVLRSCALGAGRWLESVAKDFNEHEELFLEICRRILNAEHREEVGIEDAYIIAINSPVGLVTRALLRLIFRDNRQNMQRNIIPILTHICNRKIDKFRHGRVILAEYAISLFRMSSEWMKENLLPLFFWQDSGVEARAVWSGFLSSAHLCSAFLEAIRIPFLDTAKHYNDLGRRGKSYVNLLTLVALEVDDVFQEGELARATQVLPEGVLQDAARSVEDRLELAGEKRLQYWNQHVAFYFQSVWPASVNHRTQDIASSLARVCIAAGEAFPNALQELRFWLMPLESPDSVVYKLYVSDLCPQFPKDTLEFLYLVVGEAPLWTPITLSDCLKDIRAQSPSWTSDQCFRELWNQARRAGQA